MINDLSDLRTCLPEAIINGRDMLLQMVNKSQYSVVHHQPTTIHNLDEDFRRFGLWKKKLFG